MLQTVCSTSFDILIRSYRSNLIFSSFMVCKCSKRFRVCLSAFNISCLQISYTRNWRRKNLGYRSWDTTVNFIQSRLFLLDEISVLNWISHPVLRHQRIRTSSALPTFRIYFIISNIIIQFFTLMWLFRRCTVNICRCYVVSGGVIVFWFWMTTINIVVNQGISNKLWRRRWHVLEALKFVLRI